MESYIILKNQAPPSWSIDEDGMLRCEKVAVMRSGVMTYYAGELLEGGGEVPAHLLDQEIRLYVPPEELASPQSLKTLEGVPVGVDHEWQVAGSIEAKGNIAGKPVYDDNSGLLFSSLKITDPATIARITEKDSSYDKLVDISSGYRNTTDWEAGITPAGEAYDGIQRNIGYNHVALLAQGLGRGGDNVKIYNRVGKKRVDQMSEYTSVAVGKFRIKVMNEDVDKLQNVMDDKDKAINDNDDKNKNAIDPAQLEETMSKLTEVNKQVDELTGERDTLRGQLQDAQNKLDEVLNPDNMAAAVEDATMEQENAGAILNAYKAKEPDGIKKMFGHPLRVAVVNAVRAINKNNPMTVEHAENEGFVKGSFTVLQECALTNKSSKTVNGAAMIGAMGTDGSKKTAWDMTAEQRKNRIYYGNKGAE